MKTDSLTLVQQVMDSLYLAEQIDLLHLSIASLTGTIETGGTDLFLDVSHKSPTQKKLYLQKLLAEVRSPQLKKVLDDTLQAGDIDFFLRAHISEFLAELDHEIESITIIRLGVAIEFKDKDIRELIGVLEKRLDQKVAFDIEIDPTLIGGAVIQHGNYISDYSLKSRLDQFREEWKEATFSKKAAN